MRGARGPVSASRDVLLARRPVGATSWPARARACGEGRQGSGRRGARPVRARDARRQAMVPACRTFRPIPGTRAGRWTAAGHGGTARQRRPGRPDRLPTERSGTPEAVASAIARCVNDAAKGREIVLSVMLKNGRRSDQSWRYTDRYQYLRWHSPGRGTGAAARARGPHPGSVAVLSARRSRPSVPLPSRHPTSGCGGGKRRSRPRPVARKTFLFICFPTHFCTFRRR